MLEDSINDHSSTSGYRLISTCKTYSKCIPIQICNRVTTLFFSKKKEVSESAHRILRTLKKVECPMTTIIFSGLERRNCLKTPTRLRNSSVQVDREFRWKR